MKVDPLKRPVRLETRQDGYQYIPGDVIPYDWRKHVRLGEFLSIVVHGRKVGRLTFGTNSRPYSSVKLPIQLSKVEQAELEGMLALRGVRMILSKEDTSELFCFFDEDRECVIQKCSKLH